MRVGASFGRRTFTLVVACIAALAIVIGMQAGAGGTATAQAQNRNLLSVVAELLCPPVRELENLLRETTGIDAGLTALVCATGLLEYDYYTTWEAPNGGTITRTTHAVVGVPTPINVDADPAADLVGTLGAANLQTLQLNVERASGEASDLPVSLEAVLSDSSRATLGREHLAFGFDSRGDRTPGRFNLSTPLSVVFGARGDYEFNIAQVNRGERIALIGSLFDGPLGQRVDPTEVRLDYGASPDTASIKANLNDGLSATLTTNRPGPTDLSGRSVSGSTEQSALIEMRDMPTRLSLNVDSESGAINYDASAPMDRLSAEVDTGEPFFLGASHFRATLLEVPEAFQVVLGRDGGNLGLTADQPIGQLDLQARSSNESFPEIADGEAGATLHSSPDRLAMALRTFRLRELTFSPDPIALRSQMEGGRIFRVDVNIDQGEGPLAVQAVLDKLPSEVELGLDSQTGELSYDASDPMDRLTAAVSTPQPVLLGAEHFEVEMLEVPQSFRLGIGQDAGNFGLFADQPIGQLDLRARSDLQQFPEIPAGEAGVILDATRTELALALRTFRLEELSFSLDPIALRTRMEGGRVFTVDASIDQGDGPFSIDAVLDRMPSELDLGFDSDNGEISYQASDPMDRLFAAVSTPQPVLLGAEHFEVEMLGVPQSFTLGIGQDSSGLDLSSDQPIGQLDLRARSDARQYPVIPTGEAGAILDSTGGELALALRAFGLEHLGFSFDPFRLESRMEGGRVFTVDAKLDQTDEQGTPLPPIEALAVIDKLPSEITIEIADGEAPPAGPGGTVLGLASSDPIDVVSLATEGLELLEGASSVKAEINDVPTELTVALPEEGPLAEIAANDHIGQLRLAAAAQDAQLPARSIAGDPVLHDLFRFKNLPSEFDIGLRLSALKELSVNLDPVNLSLEQDAARTRPISLDAAFPSGNDTVTVTGLLNKPHTRTSMSVELDPDQPSRLVFDNSANMQRFELQATGLSGISAVNMAFDNLSRRMAICMDPGPACQRPNPHSVQRYATAQTTGASMDFDDFGTHGSGLGSSFRTTLNASVAFDQGNPVTIQNLRFRNLGFDFQNANNNHSSNCGTIPRISLFFDSRGHPFVINSLKFPPTINDFRIGTDGNPARARNRIARLNGWSTGTFGCLGGLSTSSAGAMNCGGQSVLNVNTPLGNINILNFLGFQLLPVCGGTVSNPQPW